MTVCSGRPVASSKSALTLMSLSVSYPVITSKSIKMTQLWSIHLAQVSKIRVVIKGCSSDQNRHQFVFSHLFQKCGINNKVFLLYIDGVNDLLSLGDFNEGALLHTIRERHSRQQIYTSIGSPILLSVNPFQRLNIFNTTIAQTYR